MSLVYQTLQFPCDREYNAEPLNYTGIRTIKLTNKPANVEVWISTDNTGQNLFPLKNRGDGWVNLDEPLQNCYIYTSGLNNTGEMLILNVTGQKDIFEYGTSSVERIGNVQELYMLQNLSPNAIAQIAKAIQGIYYKPPIHTIKIQGEAKPNQKEINAFIFPIENIATLKLSNEKYYSFDIIGHLDVGTVEDLNSGLTGVVSYCSVHLCLFNNTNNATFSDLDLDFNNCKNADKNPWASDITDLFDIIGLKFSHTWFDGTGGMVLENQGINTIDKPLILKGDIINSYEFFALNFKSQRTYNGKTLTCHSSLLVNIYEMETYDQLIGANK